jgi:multisubunit Na+/H+ antiporter MnhG subunit
MARQIAAAVILFAATAFALIAALGVLRSKNNLAALHCLGVANVMLPPLMMLAVLVDVGVGVSAVKTLVLMVIMLLCGPATSHAIAVAEYRRNPRR